MTNRIRELIDQHFCEKRRTSLMASVIENWSDDDILDALEVPHRSIRKLAFDRLLALFSEGDPTDLIAEGLRGSASMKSGLLLALSALPVEKNSLIEQLVLSALDDDETEVRTSAARAVAFRFPRCADALLQYESRPGFSEILRHLCYSRCVELIPEIARVSGFPDRRLPPTIGILVDQYWLANNVSEHHALVKHLAEECGFSNVPLNDNVLNLWTQGLNCVTQEMLNEETTGWRERSVQLGWQFLPDSFSMSSSQSVAVDVNDPLDRGLFLSAIREADREQVSLIRTRHPFSIQFHPGAANAICCHAKLFFAEQLFIDRASKLAQELQIHSHDHGEFWIDHARTQLILDAGERAESESILRARWLVRSQGYGATKEVRQRIEKDEDFPEAKRLVLKGLPELLPDSRFCSGTQSILNLANANQLEGVEDWLASGEATWKPKLIPVGMELQVPVMNANRIIAWKQALRYLGVNSPRRPEYHRMTEASFPPVPTFHSAVLGPLLLARLGMIEFPQDIAMHLSFQGDLGDSVRYLAFPQLFIHPSQRSRKRAPWTIAPLMSKGLVNLNKDVLQCDPLNPATCRTEIRVFRCVAEKHESQIQLSDLFIDDVISNHVLASAILMNDQETNQHLRSYFDSIEAYAQTLGDEYLEFLHANYYDATGEPEDVAMLEYLPVLQKRKAARQGIPNLEVLKDIEHKFLERRSKCVRQIAELWFGPQDHGLIFPKTACKIALPEALQSP